MSNIEVEAKQVYIVPWKTHEDKNAFNDANKYGFYPHPIEMGTGNAKHEVGVVIFKPLPALALDNIIVKKMMEVLGQEDVYQYFKTHFAAKGVTLLQHLKSQGIRYSGYGKGNHKPMLWKKGKSFLAHTWYACIDYRDKPTVLTVRSMLLPFFEFGNKDIVDSCVPGVQDWLAEGKLAIGDAEEVKQSRKDHENGNIGKEA